MSRFDAVGQAVGAPATISFATAGELIWHGSGYFAVYRDDSYVIYFLELSSEAEPIGSTVVVSSSSFRPQVAWTGQELAIIVQQAPSLAWLLRVGPDGRRLADPLQLDFPCCAPDTFHAIDGGFVVASDEQAPHLAWLDSEGRLLERTPVGSGRRPVAEAVVWTGSEIGLIYSVLSDATTLDLVFQRVER